MTVQQFYFQSDDSKNKKIQNLNGYIRVKIGKLKSTQKFQGKLNQGLKTGRCLKLRDANIAEISGTFGNGILKVTINMYYCYYNLKSLWI